MSRVLPRVLAALALALTLGPGTAQAAPAATPPPPPALVVDSRGPTQGTPVPGSFLTADLGSWQPPGPESYTFQWLRDGVPIPGATVGTTLANSRRRPPAGAPGHREPPGLHVDRPSSAPRSWPARSARCSPSMFAVSIRPGQARLVWTAITFMSIERPWATDGGTVTAFKRRTAGSRSSVGRRSPAVRRSCGCPGSGRRSEDLRAGLLPRQRRGRGVLLAVRRRAPRRLARSEPARRPPPGTPLPVRAQKSEGVRVHPDLPRGACTDALSRSAREGETPVRTLGSRDPRGPMS